MGMFNVEIGIGHRDREEWKTLDALVDTGASVTAAPASLLRELGVERRWTQSFTLTDGATREMDVGLAMVRWASMEQHIRYGEFDSALVMQHRLVVQEAANKWQAQQSQRKNEAAQRFFVRAKGWATLGFAFGGGSAITLVIEHLLLT